MNSGHQVALLRKQPSYLVNFDQEIGYFRRSWNYSVMGKHVKCWKIVLKIIVSWNQFCIFKHVKPQVIANFPMFLKFMKTSREMSFAIAFINTWDDLATKHVPLQQKTLSTSAIYQLDRILRQKMIYYATICYWFPTYAVKLSRATFIAPLHLYILPNRNIEGELDGMSANHNKMRSIKVLKLWLKRMKVAELLQASITALK